MRYISALLLVPPVLHLLVLESVSRSPAALFVNPDKDAVKLFVRNSNVVPNPHRVPFAVLKYILGYDREAFENFLVVPLAYDR